MPDRRLPPGWVAAAYLGHLPSIVGLLVAGALATARPDVWPGPAAWLVLGPFLAFRLVDPWYERLTTRFAIDDQALTLRTGLLHRRIRSVRWQDVRAVDVVTPWGHRALGLVRITVAQAGDDDTRMRIPAADATTRAEVLRRAEPHLRTSAREPAGPADAEQRSTDADAPAPGELLYRASVTDLLLASLVFGQFAVAGAAAAAALWELIDTLGLASTAIAAVEGGPLTAAAGAAALILAVGGGLTVLKYWSFEVRATAAGQLSIRYGLVEDNDRRVGAEGIAGVSLRQNPLEMLLGRVRLGLLTADSAAQLGTNLLLPSLPRSTVTRVLGRVLGDTAPPVDLGGRAALPRSLASAILVVAPAGGLLALLLSRGLAPWASISLALVALLLADRLARFAASTLRFDPARTSLSLSIRHIDAQQRTVLASAVHAVSSASALGRPVLVRAHYFAGAPRTLTSARFRIEEVTQLRSCAAHGSRQALLERIARRRASPR